jgi:UDP-N-acetylmuramoyl-tripeptide--D-alanyl-D-alanine ligase
MLALGIGSDRLHFEIGEFAAEQGIDCLICSGDDARYILDGFKSKKTNCTDAHFFVSKSDLAEALPNLIKKDDMVLVKASNGMKFNEFLPVLRRL